MMVYQFVGDVLDVDQLSDKHKISLFDESKYDDNMTIDASISKSLAKRRILKDGDPLAGGDSLCDENLIN